jgi:hypothetical protein
MSHLDIFNTSYDKKKKGQELNWQFDCRNPSLGLATKARGCKVAGQEGVGSASLHVLMGVQKV